VSEIRLVVMSGLPGSGKSTVAEGIARALRIPLLSVDPIESAVIEAGVQRGFETGLAAYLVARRLAHEQLRLGNSAVIDAVNAEEEGKDIWRNLAKDHAMDLILIECFITDGEIYRRRLESRVRNLVGMPEVSWDQVEQRQAHYTDWKEPVLRLDSTQPAGSNIQRALDYIRSR
jgi:predicted kinase